MIVPNSEVFILKNVPLEPSFDHTIWFDSADQQATAFTTYALAFYFDKVSYQRYPRPYITLDKTVDELLGCNYLMFRNTGYGENGSMRSLRRLSISAIRLRVFTILLTQCRRICSTLMLSSALSSANTL